MIKRTNIIQIDCAPGNIRPGDILKEVIQDTELKYKEPISTFMGEWTWEYNEIDTKLFIKIKDIIFPKLKKAYDEGRIRYAFIDSVPDFN